MTPERFHQIVEAYGADPRRWPSHERTAGEAWAAQHRAEADTILSSAADVDAWLATDRVAPPDAALQQRIIGSASLRPVRPPATRRRLWWSGAAVAGVGLLGGLAGAFAVSFFVMTENGPPLHDSSYLTSSFGGSAADWSGE